MKSTSDILSLLKLFKEQNSDRYKFSSIGVFGSVARGEQSETSDVDIFYEGEAQSLFASDGLQSALENLLGCSVDIIRLRDQMNNRVRTRILKECIYV